MSAAEIAASVDAACADGEAFFDIAGRLERSAGEPDPANPRQREFAWMTVHHYTADRAVTYPFQDWHSLEK